MWKIIFEYSDKSKTTITGQHKEIPPQLIEKYYKLYGVTCKSATYYRYPLKTNIPCDFIEMYEMTFKKSDQKKMQETNDNRLCKSCRYGMGTNNYKVYCDYLSITGHTRGCPIGYCDKYEKKKRGKKSCY